MSWLSRCGSGMQQTKAENAGEGDSEHLFWVSFYSRPVRVLTRKRRKWLKVAEVKKKMLICETQQIVSLP